MSLKSEHFHLSFERANFGKTVQCHLLEKKNPYEQCEYENIITGIMQNTSCGFFPSFYNSSCEHI